MAYREKHHPLPLGIRGAAQPQPLQVSYRRCLAPLTPTQNNVIALRGKKVPGLATSEPYYLVSQLLRLLAKVGECLFGFFKFKQVQ